MPNKTSSRPSSKFRPGYQTGILTLQSAKRKKDKYGIRHRYWKCKCRCGKIITATDQMLLTGLTLACPECITEIETPELATKLGSLLRTDCNKSNTLGIRGVYYNAKSNKYAAYITFQNIRIRIGSYGTPEIAKEARDEFVNQFRPMLNRMRKEKELYT